LAAAFAGLMGSSVIGLCALFQLVVFEGQDFLEHAFRFHLIGFHLPFLQMGIFAFGILFLVPFLVALEAVRVHRERLLLLYLLVAVALALATLGKVGGGWNYFLESICLMSALFAVTCADRADRAPARMKVLAVLGVALLLGQYMELPTPNAADFEKDQAIQDYLRSGFPPKTPALSYYAGDLLRAGLTSPISNIYQYSNLIRQGILTDQHLASAIENQRFKVIVLTCDVEQEDPQPTCVRSYLTPRLAKIIIQSYRLDKRFELPSPQKQAPQQSFYAWVPKATGEAGDQPPGP
jgi:hypothetical protein